MHNASEATSFIGRCLCERYRVLGHIGSGGVAQVYEVLDESRCARLALKVLGPNASKKKELQFRREFHAMVRLHHRNIVRVDDYGVDARSGQFYTMELLAGGDITNRPEPSVDALAQLLYDTASGLGFLHAKRLIHRDVSTRNVRFTADGTAKLIDFGLLSTPGVVIREMAGTPPFIAPETLWGGELDPRVDLFSLGALAYRYWTGHHAFPARSTSELPKLWEAPPTPPNEIRPGLPEELDALIVQLLSREPVGRPASAIEVADRAAAVAAKPLSPRDAARAYLTSCELVGREHELEKLRQGIEALGAGTGSLIAVSAPSGFGKSRLLRETVLEARVAGFHALSVECGAGGSGPYAVLRTVIDRVHRERPASVKHAARRSSPWLARLFPDIAAEAGFGHEPPPLQDPAEDRLRLLAALTGFLSELVRQEPLALILDDFQRCDAGSASVLAGFFAEQPALLAVLGHRTDEPGAVADGVPRLLAEAQSVQLEGLSGSEVQSLVVATFGVLDGGAQLASVLHRITGGNPMHCFFVMQALVDTNKLRYLDGEWLITAEVTASDLPPHLTDAALAQWPALGKAAQRLVELLAVVGPRASFDLAEALSPVPGELFFDAVNELCVRGFLLADDQELRFRHDGVREAILRQLEEEPRRLLHRRIAETLLAHRSLTARSDFDGEVGWHLYHGGAARRAARFLSTAGVRLWRAQAFAESVPALEAALEHSDRLTIREATDLRQMLLASALFAEARLAERYGHETLGALSRMAGVASFDGLKPLMGRHLAFLLGLAKATLQWLIVGLVRREPSPVAALRQLVSCASFTMAVECARDRWHRAQSLRRVLEPVAAFRGSTGRAGDLFVGSFFDLMMGHLASALDSMSQLEGLLASRPFPRLHAFEEAQAHGAIRYTRTFVAASDHQRACLDLLGEVNELGLRFFDLSGQAAIVVFHRLRGEETIAHAMEVELRPRLARLSSWLPEVQLTWFSAVAYALHGNAPGLKAALAALQVAVERGRLDASVVAYFSGEYDRLRGRYGRAIPRLERALSEIPAEERILRPGCLAALAMCLRKKGRLSEAEVAATTGVEIAADPRAGRRSGSFRPELELAAILLERGQFDEAESRLRKLEQHIAPLASPALDGLLAEARAKASWGAGDRVGFVHHLDHAIAVLTPTDNATLLANVLELRERAESADLNRRPSTLDSNHPSGSGTATTGGSRSSESEMTAVDRGSKQPQEREVVRDPTSATVASSRER